MTTNQPVNLPESHRNNLRQLAAYLAEFKDTPQRQFDMGVFDIAHNFDSVLPTCGSVGCAVGHGPYAGLSKLDGEIWRDYSHRVFIPETHATVIDNLDEAWDWCFSEDWHNWDNTAAGAALRILWLLDKGLPDNHQDQRDGGAPLCYCAEGPSCPN